MSSPDFQMCFLPGAEWLVAFCCMNRSRKNLKYDRNMTEISRSAGKTCGGHKQGRKVTLTARNFDNQVRAKMKRAPRVGSSRVLF